jgi:hypothetical protein
MSCNGAAEYAPELGLWFGLQRDPEHRLYAFGLSRPAAWRTPVVLHPGMPDAWDYLDLDGLPAEWPPIERHLVNIGSGKFCVVTYCLYSPSPSDDEELTVLTRLLLTGVEVVDSGNGLQMIKHRSHRCTVADPDGIWSGGKTCEWGHL